MSAVQFENEIRWDGNSLAVWATVNGSRIYCEIPRSTIHLLAVFAQLSLRKSLAPETARCGFTRPIFS